MTNRLASETSPYLRQHQANPVDWYPWGDEAFEAAERRDVPVLLSVGYSSCHWCHVMAHESFEDTEVADAVNRAFVNVKVDREERPDIDAIYMDAVQAMTGRGGWPMTVFLTPRREPFYGGTYFPKDSFLKLTDAVASAWRERRDDLLKNVAALQQAISRSADVKAADQLPEEVLISATVAGLAKAFDVQWGGFGQAPKFPQTTALDLCLAELVYRRAQPEPTERHRQSIENLTTIVTTSLDAMASGGMYDHLGGGFARYSVDERWLVPHFEKMLYDQALLVRVYTHAAAALADRIDPDRIDPDRIDPDRIDTGRWRHVVDATVGYVLRELQLPGGGFASAQDADSPGPDGRTHEGLYYTWTPEEVETVVGGGTAPAVCRWYGITAEGNFAEPGEPLRSIPNRLEHRGDWIPPTDIGAARDQLLAARDQRPPPALDDKVLTEWNALMIASLADAGSLLGRPAWIKAAVGAADFLLAELRGADGRWLRAWHASGDPPARHAALAADHANLVDAFVRLGEATGQSRWIAEAMSVADLLLDHFWDPAEGGLYATPDDGEHLIARQKDLFDGATPSANSVAANALYRLGALSGEQRYGNHADRILQLIGPLVPNGASGFTNALSALALRRRGIAEVVVAGDRPDMLAVVRERYRPAAVVAWGERFESPLWQGREDGWAYVCEHYTCQAPQDTAEGLRAALDR